jgi:serine O-acetyltransferase
MMTDTAQRPVSREIPQGPPPREIPYPGLFRAARADLALLCRGNNTVPRRAIAILTNRGFQALFLYRLARSFTRMHIPLIPLLLSRFAQFAYAVDISPLAQLGPGIALVHCFGIVVGSATRIEGDCVIFHGVTFGDRGSEWVGDTIPDGHPYVEKSCMFGAGAKILGPLTIGKNSVIGANAVVIRNVPPNSVAAGMPAKVISQRPEMDENLRPIHGHRSKEKTG